MIVFRRSLPPGRIYEERLAQELAIIEQFHFGPVFERVRAILDLSADIPHITRGSAGSSLVCYLMGITDFDPVAHQFALARFMHMFRPDLPDIDIDYPYDRRDEVLDRVFAQFPGRVARISNHVMYRKRSAVRQALREYGRRRFLPKYFDFEDEAGLFKGETLTRAEQLLGTQKNFAKHCGGGVPFDDQGPDHPKLTETQIRLDKDEVEAAGLIKIDLLCNRGLAQLVELSGGKSPMAYPEEDAATAALFARGDTLGVTFAESPAQRKLSQGIGPRCRDDVVLAIALIRPVPSADGRKIDALRQWQQHRHTKGHLIYDEDGIYLIQDVLGCGEDEAEVIRKGFAKGTRGVMEGFYERVKHRPDASGLFQRLSYYQLYSFCRAHAYAYGYLVWALAYEKVRQPHRFWMAALNHAASQYRPWVHVQEAKKAGLCFGNFGRRPWTLEGNTLYSTRPDTGVMDGWAQFTKRGFWTSNRFMPGMALKRDGVRVWFKGLVGCGRHHTVGGRQITFLTVGVATGQYLELIVQELVPYDRWDIVEGEGLQQEDGSIHIVKIAGKKV